MGQVYRTDSNGDILEVPALDNIEVITANTTLDLSYHGKTLEIGTDSLTMTLPAVGATTAPKGMWVKFRNVGADGNNIITISPNASDAIFGSLPSSEGANADATTADGLVSKASGTDDKDWVNTKATANKGDWCKLVSDGSTGWYIDGGVGEWASEA